MEGNMEWNHHIDHIPLLVTPAIRWLQSKAHMDGVMLIIEGEGSGWLQGGIAILELVGRKAL